VHHSRTVMTDMLLKLLRESSEICESARPLTMRAGLSLLSCSVRFSHVGTGLYRLQFCTRTYMCACLCVCVRAAGSSPRTDNDQQQIFSHAQTRAPVALLQIQDQASVCQGSTLRQIYARKQDSISNGRQRVLPFHDTENL
jgi:hypothetical protein